MGSPRRRSLEAVSILVVSAESPTVFRNRTVPDSVFLASTPLQSSFAHSPAPRLRSELTCLGFGPLCGITGGVYFPQKFPLSATCRPQVFATSRRFAPPSGSPGLFHPGATSRVRLRSRRFSLRTAFFPRREELPPHCSRATANRLSPTATAAPANLEVLIRAEQRSDDKGFSFAARRCLLRVLERDQPG